MTDSAAAPASAEGAPAPLSPADTLYPNQESAQSAAGVSSGAEPDEPTPEAPGESGGSETGAGAATEGGAGEESTAGGESGTDALAASYELALPEGFEADDALMASARETFAAAGVPKDKAQALIDLYATATRANAQRELDAFTATQAEWAREVDTLLGASGPTREKAERDIGAFLDEYGPEAKAGILSDPRVGNNPQLIALIHKAASLLSEGTPVLVGRPAANDANGRSIKGKSAAEVLYPDQAQG